MPVDNLLCGPLQIPRARVVTQPSPRRENVTQVGFGESLDGWKSLEKPMPVGNDRRDLCLLEHHLAHPDRVGIARSSPREVAPGRFVPIEEIPPEIFRPHAHVRPPWPARP